jgi:hypothetical protein
VRFIVPLFTVAFFAACVATVGVTLGVWSRFAEDA